MDASNHEKELLFLRRMLWWIPPLSFAVWAAVLWMVGVWPSVMTPVEALFNALIGSVLVGAVVWGGYFAYKYFSERAAAPRT